MDFSQNCVIEHAVSDITEKISDLSSSLTVSKLFFGTFRTKTLGSKGVVGFLVLFSIRSLVNISNSSSIFFGSGLAFKVSALAQALSGSKGVVLGIRIFLWFLNMSFGGELSSCSKFSFESLLLYIEV